MDRNDNESQVVSLARLSAEQDRIARDPLTIEIVCDRVANDGLTIGAVARSMGVRGRWLKNLIYANPAWRQQLEAAQAQLADEAVAETHADLMQSDDPEDAKLHERRLRGSLAVAKHWHPDKYGDRLQVDHGGTVSIRTAIEAGLSRAAITIDAEEVKALPTGGRYEQTNGREGASLSENQPGQDPPGVP